MKRKRVIIHKVQIDLDPRYAAEHPHDWRLSRTCGSLIPNRCSECGSGMLSDKPSLIVRAARAKFGRRPSPSLFRKSPIQEAPSKSKGVSRIR